MESTQQVILVTKVLVLVGPLAAYFMILGLFNCQPTPRLLDTRKDFLVLMAALTPLLLAPAASAAGAGHAWVLPAALLLIALITWLILPRRQSGWVIYNLSAARARVLVERCLTRLNWPHESTKQGFILHVQRIEITFSSLPALRNVTCHVSPAGNPSDTAAIPALRQALERSLAGQQLLPSVAGSCLMILGVGLIILPLWMMTRHASAIAEVVTRLLPS